MSGMQTFAGEDLKYEKRRQLQQEQIRFSLSLSHTHTHTHTYFTHNVRIHREWTAAQIAEKERLITEQKHADRLYDMKACELDQRTVDLASAEAETRRNITIATKEYNLALVHTHTHTHTHRPAI